MANRWLPRGAILEVVMTGAPAAVAALLLACTVSTARSPAPVPPAGPPGKLSGRVLDPAGKPLEGAILSLISRRLGQNLAAVSGAGGGYDFPQVPASKDWRLHAEASGFQWPGDKRVRIAPGEDVSQDVKLDELPRLRRFTRGPDGEIVSRHGMPRGTEGWRVVSGDDLFTLMLPPGLEEVPGRGQDPWVRDFEGPGIYVAYRFGYTYGPYTCEGMIHCREMATIVGGLGAQWVSYEDPKPPDELKYFQGLFFEYTGNGDATVSVWAFCKGPEEVRTARRILGSVRFP